MNYLIGMDGGGTKTACVVTDMDGNILHSCTGGPSTFILIGTEKVCEMLFSLVSECREKLGAEYSDFKAILLGTTGAGRRSDAEKLESAFCEYLRSKNITIPFYVESDARIALEGAFAGNPGSIMIAGTGSIMFGKDSDGNIHRVGGFGRFIGDQGSGYMIGRRGLIMVSKHFDGRGSETMLTFLLGERFGILTSEQLITEIYKNGFDIASAAPLVIEAAEKGDKICMDILDEEAGELIEHIKAMSVKINEKQLLLSFIGGIISSDNFFARLFIERVKNETPHVKIIDAEFPPAMGAVLMARNKVS